ncbi:MAG: hypothetical protein LBI27_04425, partial [Clostridiales bacterium]|nr:hypothetical protein [Clostridiales bacterium]
MKKTVVLLMLLFFLPLNVRAEEVLFERDEYGRYVIRTARQLSEIQLQANLFFTSGGVRGSLDFLSADYILANDIILDENFMPIGDFTNPRFAFGGSFDGAGFAIRGLEISRRGVTHGL